MSTVGGSRGQGTWSIAIKEDHNEQQKQQWCLHHHRDSKLVAPHTLDARLPHHVAFSSPLSLSHQSWRSPKIRNTCQWAHKAAYMNMYLHNAGSLSETVYQSEAKRCLSTPLKGTSESSLRDPLSFMWSQVHLKREALTMYFLKILSVYFSVFSPCTVVVLSHAVA